MCILAGIGLRRRKEWFSAPETLLLSALMSSFSISVILALALNFNLQPRHVYFLAPLGMTLIGSLLSRAVSFKSPLCVLGFFGLVGLLSLNLYSLSNYYFDSRYARDDYRATAAFLSRQPESAARVLLWGSPELLAYYGAGNIMDGRKLRRENLGEQLAALTGYTSDILVVVNRLFYWFNGASVPDAVGDTYALQSTTKFQNFAIYHFVLADSS
jgi:hypothetical protein